MSTSDTAPRNDAQTGSSRRSSPSTAAADLEPGALRHATSLAPQIGDRVRIRDAEGAGEWIVSGAGLDGGRAAVTLCGVTKDDETPAVEFLWADDVTVIARAAYYDPSTEVAVRMTREDAEAYHASLLFLGRSMTLLYGHSIDVVARVMALAKTLHGALNQPASSNGETNA